MKGLFPGLTFIFEFFLYSSVNIDRYFFSKMSFSSMKNLCKRHCSLQNEGFTFIGKICSFIIFVTLAEMESTSPFFLNFYAANLTIDSMNWKRTKPRSGTKLLPFQSAPDIELVVIKVRSIILRGVSLEIILA